MLHLYWVDIPSKLNFVHFQDFQFDTFFNIYCQFSFIYLLLTVFSLLAIFAEVSTFQKFDLHLELSTLKFQELAFEPIERKEV